MHPFQIIQGGMGVGVSHWRLANAVSRERQLGVVSGTGIGAVLARRLQVGDPGGDMRRALARFPLRPVAQRIVARYFVDFGKSQVAPFVSTPVPNQHLTSDGTDLLIAANFVEVFLAKEQHKGVVGINYLEKLQCDHLASLYGAMLAGVDYVLMGAGIPRFIPGAIDALSRHEKASYRLDVEGALAGEEFNSTFDPAAWWNNPARNPTHMPMPALKRPHFFAIISSIAVMILAQRYRSFGLRGKKSRHST